MSDPLLVACWHILNERGWYEFNFSQVIEAYSEWDLDQILMRFPSKHHLVEAFSKNIPFQYNTLEDPKEKLFDAVMIRLDVLWPYRSVMAHAFLEMPPSLMGPISIHVMRWFYAYWKSNITQNNESANFRIVNENIQGDDFFWITISLVLYRAILPYALTHSYANTLARLDQWISFLWDFKNDD